MILRGGGNRDGAADFRAAGGRDAFLGATTAQAARCGCVSRSEGRSTPEHLAKGGGGGMGCPGAPRCPAGRRAFLPQTETGGGS